LVTAVSSQIDLPPGTIFASDYRVERALAQGGMGAVYVVHQLSTGRDRALKLMHPNLLRDEGMRRRFEQEAKVGSRIKSEHVVQVLAAGIDESSRMPWLVMELLEGEDLAACVARRGPLPLGEVVEILGQIGHALANAHAVGVVHRDLKPENVFLSRTHREGAPVTVKVLDMGIAKIVADAHPSDTAAVGTPLWMAPEQTGGTVGPPTDVWAMGLLAFFMLTGRSYWLGGGSDLGEASLMKVLREVVIDPLETASARASRFGCAGTLPAGFDAWFGRCVARETSARFRDAGEARTEFARVMVAAGDTIALAPALLSSPELRRRGDSAPMQSAPTLGATFGDETAGAPGGSRVALGVGAMVLGAVASFALSGRWLPASSTTSAAVETASATSTASSAPPPSHSAAIASAASSSAPPPPPADLDDSETVWNVPLADSPRRGPDDALVTIVEFANFQCPFSKGVDKHLPKLLEEHPHDVRLVWKDDPLAIHSQAESAAMLAREAGAQKGEAGFWSAHDLLADRDFVPTPSALLTAAKKLKLDVPRVEKAIAERRHADLVAQDADLADDFEVVGTPYFFVNGRRVRATPKLDKLRSFVQDEILRVGKLVEAGEPRQGLYERLVSGGRGALPLQTKTFRHVHSAVPGRGAELASVFLLEFCDFSNFLCRLVDPTVDQLLKKFPNELGAMWIDVPNGSQEAHRAALAARVAYRQKGIEGFDRMRKLLFDGQQVEDGLSSRAVERYAQSVGFARAEFRSALEDPEVVGEVERDAQAARNDGITEPAAFLICAADYCASGGYYLSGVNPTRSFEKRIRLVIDAKGDRLPTAPAR
jgi:serine/threonine protein kinase/predicted DsbA family dithiol-disulfide isomerase